MRIRLADLSSTNSWNQVVLGSFIKLFTKKPKVQEPNLIEEYKNLEYDKVKKIVSSIPSLNECIDKKYFQSIIDKMNKKKIDQVETHISNQVIVNYEKEKEKSKVARFKYLKRKADVKGTEIKCHDQELQREKEKGCRKEENIKVAKRFRVVLRGLDNNLVKLKSNHEHKQLERFHNPKKKGLPEPLDIPAELTEAYRNKIVYEYFKDCPDKPKFKHDKRVEYSLQTTTGGPLKTIKVLQVSSQEQVARAALVIQRAIRRWRKRRNELKMQKEMELRRQLSTTHTTVQNRTFFVTQSNDETPNNLSQNTTGIHKHHIQSPSNLALSLQKSSVQHHQNHLHSNSNNQITFNSAHQNLQANSNDQSQQKIHQHKQKQSVSIQEGALSLNSSNQIMTPISILKSENI